MFAQCSKICNGSVKEISSSLFLKKKQGKLLSKKDLQGRKKSYCLHKHWACKLQIYTTFRVFLNNTCNLLKEQSLNLSTNFLPMFFFDPPKNTRKTFGFLVLRGICNKPLERNGLSSLICKKGVLENFTKFTGKHLCQSLFFNKVIGRRPQQVFFYEFYEIIQNIVLQITSSGWF